MLPSVGGGKRRNRQRGSEERRERKLQSEYKISKLNKNKEKREIINELKFI